VNKTTYIFAFALLTVFVSDSRCFAQGPISAGDQAAYDAKKRDFLLTPIFQTSKENYRPPISKDGNRAAGPLMENLDPNKLKKLPLPKLAPTGAKDVSSNKIISKAPVPRLPDSIKSNEPAAPEPKGDCGYDEFLKNYCFYPAADGEWKICSELWGTCLIRNQR
jgi:hypothetical protein